MEANSTFEETSSGNGNDITYTLSLQTNGKCELKILYSSADEVHENYTGTYNLSNDKQSGTLNFVNLLKCDNNTCEQVKTDITVNIKKENNKIKFQSGNKVISHQSFLY
jgi:hypothetical protein